MNYLDMLRAEGPQRISVMPMHAILKLFNDCNFRDRYGHPLLMNRDFLTLLELAFPGFNADMSRKARRELAKQASRHHPEKIQKPAFALAA